MNKLCNKCQILFWNEWELVKDFESQRQPFGKKWSKIFCNHFVSTITHSSLPNIDTPKIPKTNNYTIGHVTTKPIVSPPTNLKSTVKKLILSKPDSSVLKPKVIGVALHDSTTNSVTGMLGNMTAKDYHDFSLSR